MQSQRTDEAWIGRLIGRLKSLVPEGREPDRATLAKLRRGLGKPVGKGGERDIWLFRSLAGAAPDDEEPAALIASLFAMHPKDGNGGLGTAFRRLFDGRKESPSVEKRFAALLDADAEDLPDRLRHAISLLKADDIPIDWRTLLQDLVDWDRERRRVQRRWAREFWAGRFADEVAETDTSQSKERTNA
jgi:CRISPR system Cascade subunit CasB